MYLYIILFHHCRVSVVESGKVCKHMEGYIQCSMLREQIRKFIIINYTTCIVCTHIKMINNWCKQAHLHEKHVHSMYM